VNSHVRPTIHVRHEQATDIDAIRDVILRAFGQEDEGRIVDALRGHGAATLSLVAAVDGVVGHIIFSPVSVGVLAGEGLGTMAVSREHQRRSIGSEP
jgi:putative acetyltransferase